MYFTNVNSFNPHNKTMGEVPLVCHITDKETEAQRLSSLLRITDDK